MAIEARSNPAFLFDLDGTLIDSVYQHVLAWREAMQQVGINLAVWKIHRRIGMSGGLFMNALRRELESELDPDTVEALPKLHQDEFLRLYDSVRPAARSRRAARDADRPRSSVGDRHQRRRALRPSRRSICSVCRPTRRS